MKLETIVFYPIPTVSLENILENSDQHSFQINPVTSHPGQLMFDLSSDSLLGVGGFKTAHAAQLVLTPPAPVGLRSLPRHDVVMKRPYYKPSDPVAQSKSEIRFNCYVLSQEVEKLFHEANVLYWAKSLMQMTYQFIDHAVNTYTIPPPFDIPCLRFVEAGLALAYTQTPIATKATSSSSTRMTSAYLLEEKIICDGVFTKFIHNVDCSPLLDPGEDGYNIAEFLCFMQHVQYIKTKGLAYIADYQGTSLPDSTVGRGKDIFGEGNLEIGVKLFETEHVCNAFCEWPGFGLKPFKDGSEALMDL
ncbi:hypothetical protein EDC04DRAFT_2571510 [Pisolithus marmoratus]|nr:hypothetical protein EDC04DRAFT_2571510 [Pisolithus marmoratus]